MIADEARATLASLLPPGVAVAVADCADASLHTLFDEERARIATSVAKRQREFAAGRQCARQALAALGVPAVPIGVGSHREPLFPSGTIGSITHTVDVAAAAVGRAGGALVGLGVDLEVHQVLEDGLARRIVPPDEAAHWTPGVPAGCSPVLLAFSLKEAFFKAFFPWCRRYLDFTDARLAHAGPGAFTVALPDPALAALMHGLRLEGRYAVDARHVYGAVTLLRA
jgi:4'-phosphopantetheinyl transferase EntD